MAVRTERGREGGGERERKKRREGERGVDEKRPIVILIATAVITQ